MDVFLLAETATLVADSTDADPTHLKDGATRNAFLAIRAKAKGSVTLTLTVKDGLPGGVSTHQIPLMVRAQNAPPVAIASVLTDTAYAAMSRTAANRIASTGSVTVDVPAGMFSDPDNDALKITAEIGGANADAIAANKEILAVSMDSSGDLVLSPKKGGPATGTIPVIIKATDPFGTTAMTGADGASSIQVKVNTPPMNTTYATGDTDIPAGKKVGDKRTLSDIVDKDYSVAGQSANPNDFITLATYFVDPDTEDSLAGNEGICGFSTNQPSGTGAYATVAFNAARDTIQVTPTKPGTFTLTVTCTDSKMESVMDSVMVTIRQ